MVGLRGSRVLVVDDDKEDALPILRALAKRGVGALFFSGSAEDVPAEAERLSGIRLAILDMDLVGAGANDKSKVAALINFLTKVLREDNGPYAVIAWTKHAELVKLFDTSLYSRADLPKPIILVKIEKAECKKGDSFDLGAISERLGQAMEQFSPLLFLQRWEEKCQDAGSDVTNALSGLAAGGAKDPERWRQEWRLELLQLMHAMAKGEAGTELKDGGSALGALYTTLGPLHADRMESRLSEVGGAIEKKSSELLSAEAIRDCGMRAKARVNTMLHLSAEGLGRFRPGNVYPLPAAGAVRALVGNVEVLAGDFGPKAEDVSQIAKVSRPVLVEASAPCDHVQGNVRLARLIAGLLVPVAQGKRVKRADYLWRLSPLFIKADVWPEGEYDLVLSARHLVSAAVKEVNEMKAGMRVRSQAFASLQTWLGHHATRPGILLLRD